MSIAWTPAPSRFIRSEAAPAVDERPPRTLADEHSLLLREVQLRTAPLLDRLLRQTWPAAELQTLVRYLRTSLLRQTSDEEVLLFPRGASPPVAELSADHARLYSITEQLGRAYDQPCSAPQLRGLVEDLLATLERHQHQEQTVLAALPGAPKDTPCVASVAADARQWPAMNDEPVVIDLDVLPEPQSIELCIERLLRLRHTETAEVFSRSHAALQRVCEWMQAFDVLRYDLTLTQREQGRSRLQVTHR